MRKAALLFLLLASLCSAKEARAPGVVFYVTMPCIDSTVPIRVTLPPERASSDLSSVWAETYAYQATVWTESEWNATPLPPDLEKQVIDSCRSRLAAMWGYVKAPAGVKQP